jgi:archaellum component FlaC
VVQHPSTSTVPPSVTVSASAAPVLQQASSEQHTTVSSLEQSQLIQSLNNFQEIILNRLDQLEQSVIHIQEQLNYLSETVEDFEHDYQS